MLEQIETLYTKYPKCPKCGTEDQDWWDGIGEKNDGDVWKANCPECNTEYSVCLHVSYTFCTEIPK